MSRGLSLATAAVVVRAGGVFGPTRIIPGIELSDDPILLFRKGVYAASARHRGGR